MGLKHEGDLDGAELEEGLSSDEESHYNQKNPVAAHAAHGKKVADGQGSCYN